MKTTIISSSRFLIEAFEQNGFNHAISGYEYEDNTDYSVISLKIESDEIKLKNIKNLKNKILEYVSEQYTGLTIIDLENESIRDDNEVLEEIFSELLKNNVKIISSD